MKNRILANTGLVLALTLTFFSAVKAQYSAITNKDGITIVIKTETVPPDELDSPDSISSYWNYSDNVVHRLMLDTKNKIYFGYDLIIEKQDEADKFKVLIKPLSKTPNQLIRRNADSGENMPDYDKFTQKALPKYPESVMLNDGDTLTLDILENKRTGAKKSDVIKVTTKPNKFGYEFAERDKAKDFTIDEVQMRLDSPEILIGGEKSKIGGGATGNIIWVYVPGKGRFIFSFAPQTGYNFQKIGTIVNNKILFDYNGESYQFINKSPVLYAGGKWNLWVMFDQNYQLSSESSLKSSYEWGSTGNVKYLFDNK